MTTYASLQQPTTLTQTSQPRDVPSRAVVPAAVTSRTPILPREKNYVSDDPFWGDRPDILLHAGRLIEFFPTADQTTEERMNAISRLVLYLGVSLSVYRGTVVPLQLAAMLVGLIYVMWRNRKLEGSPPPIETYCTMPTKENPFMNLLPGDDPARPPACEGPEVEEMSRNLLDSQLYEDVDDLFGRNNNQRQFYTMPSTQRPNDREKFGNWLFKGVADCKTDGVCPPFEDLRVARQLIPEDISAESRLHGFGA